MQIGSINFKYPSGRHYFAEFEECVVYTLVASGKEVICAVARKAPEFLSWPKKLCNSKSDISN